MALITFKQARAHTKAPFDDDGGANPADGVVELKLMMEQATAICLSFIERDADDQSPPWTVETDPTLDPEFSILQAAILRMTMHLWRWRGDDEKSPTWSRYNLPDDVEMMLHLIKDPTIA